MLRPSHTSFANRLVSQTIMLPYSAVSSAEIAELTAEAGMTRTSNGPSPREWSIHEKQIKELYSKKPLKKVMEFMEEQYRFRAT